MKIITNPNATSASDLISSTTTVQVPKIHKPLFDAQIDMKAIKAEAYATVIERSDTLDSFIPEMDTNKDGVSIEHKEAVEEMARLVENGIQLFEGEMQFAIDTANQALEKATELFATEWVSDNGNVTIRSKFLFDENDGIIIKELKSTPSRESYTVFVPSLTGLRSYRAELTHNDDLTDRYEELAELHNQHALLVNGLLPSDAEIYADLAEIDPDDAKRKVWKSANGQVWLNYYDGLLTSVKNKANAPKAKSSAKRRDF